MPLLLLLRGVILTLTKAAFSGNRGGGRGGLSGKVERKKGRDHAEWTRDEKSQVTSCEAKSL